MRFEVPELETESTDENSSFYSTEDNTMSEQVSQSNSNEYHPIIQEQQRAPTMPQEQQNQTPHPSQQPNPSILQNISPAFYQSLRDQIFREITSQLPALLPGLQSAPTQITNPQPSSNPHSITSPLVNGSQ